MSLLKGSKALGFSLCLGVLATALPHCALAASVVSIVPATSGPSRSTTETFTVTFDEDVLGVDSGDFALTTTGTASGIIGVTTGFGATHTVVVNSITGTGTLRLDLKNSGTGIINSVGTPVPGFTGGQVRVVNDAVAAVPTLTEWAMILLGLSLAGGAAFSLLRRRTSMRS